MFTRHALYAKARNPGDVLASYWVESGGRRFRDQAALNGRFAAAVGGGVSAAGIGLRVTESGVLRQ